LVLVLKGVASNHLARHLLEILPAVAALAGVQEEQDQARLARLARRLARRLAPTQFET
jgi:hypothetical protein